MALCKGDKVFINKWHRYLSTFRSIKPGQVIRVPAPAPDLWTVALHNPHEIYKENKTMRTNEQIVTAAKESKEKYQQWLKGGTTIGSMAGCVICGLYDTDCDKCVFPTCREDGTSFNLLSNHWISDHQNYVGGDYPQCVSKCCVPFGKAVIKDLNDIIKKYSEPSHEYQLSDVIEIRQGRRYKILGAGSENSICAVDINNNQVVGVGSWYLSADAFRSLKVKNINKITHSEIEEFVGGDFIHISGPTFKEPDNLCPCGKEFGKDYNICGDSYSQCNKNPMICEYKDGYKETLWYKCREQSKKECK